MALGIPLPGAPGESLLKGIDAGSMLFQRMIQPRLEREKQRQLDEHFKQEMALRKQQEARLGANSGLQAAILQQQLQKLKNSNDPMYEFNQFKMLADMMGGGQQPQDQSQGMPTDMMGQGMGVFSPEGLQGAQSMGMGERQQSNAPMMEALRQNPMLRGFFKHKFGYDPLAETSDDRRAKDFQSQVELENIKTANKAKALEDKELSLVRKDLPSIEKSLKGVDELLRIAKSNPDMFGHSIMPERFAKTTKIKDFGKWQNLISDAIAGLESKLSSRGNIVALKMAAQLKPSHAEQQQVAIGKLESMREQLLDSINHSRELLGQEKLAKEKTGIDLSNMSDEELQRIAGGM